MGWTSWLPSLIAAGGMVGGTIIGSRGVGKATDKTVAASEKAAELERLSTKEALELQREMYNRGIQMGYPWLQQSSQALTPFGRGMGLPVPEGGYNIPTLKSLMLTTDAERDAERMAGSPISTGNATLPAPGGAGAPKPGGSTLKTLLGGGAGLMVGGTLGTTLGGSLLGGTALGAFGGPIGAVAGLGAGLASNLIGRGRKEANQIVPLQNDLTAEIKRIEGILDAKASQGTLTDQDWQEAVATVTQLRDQFYDLTKDFGRAGPQAKAARGEETKLEWIDPLLASWANKQPRPMEGRMRGGPVRGKKRMGDGDYIVGENGTEILHMAPGSEGWVYPHSSFTRMMKHRQAGGWVSGQKADPNIPWQVALEKAEAEAKTRGWLPASEGPVLDPAKLYYSDTSQPGYSTPVEYTGGFDINDPSQPFVSPYTGGLQSRVGQLLVGDEYTGELPTDPNIGIRRGFPAGTPTTTPLQPNVEAFGLKQPGSTGQPLQAVTTPSVRLDRPRPQLGAFTPPRVAAPAAPQTALATQPAIPASAVPRTTMGIKKGLIEQWGWMQNEFGQWVHPETGATGYFTSGGQFINATQGKIFDPTTGKLQDFNQAGMNLPENPYANMEAPYDVYEGEFLQPWQGEFGFDPASAGFQAFNKPFSFTAEDLYSDPSYAFRLSEGQKAIERSQAAKGMLQSGPTLKALTRFGQDTASTEFGNAYNRALGRFGIGREQTEDAYNRALNEYGIKYDIFKQNQADRYGRLKSLTGIV